MRCRLLPLLLLATSATAAPKTNAIVVLVDDLGHTDLGCQGNTFHETPHLDKLAADGVRFTTAYSACTVCSPTRAALLTGQYPARLHVTDWIAGHQRPFAKLKVPDWRMHLPTETYTLAEAFKAAGYATASVGKWHLGGEAFAPEKHGFDVNLAGTHQGSPGAYFPPYGIRTLTDGPKGEYLTDRLTAEACTWITANKDRPFFLYLPHYGVHTPLGGKPAVVEKYKRKAENLGLTRNPTYAAMVQSIDDSIGTLRKTLADLGIADRTAIVFTSDNGGLRGRNGNVITTNPPFRAGKGSAYEGGVRVPLIVSGPGIGRKALSYPPAMSIDLFPTLASICKLPTPPGHTFDGTDLSAWVAGNDTVKLGLARSLYWHYPHYHPGGATPYSAVRDGEWRLIEFFEDNRVELYNLNDDIGETKDLAAAMPEKAKKLHDQLASWRKDIGAQMPAPNPAYDPAKADQPAKKR